MNEKKQNTYEFDNREQTTYQTGSTQPPKHSSGIIAFLLGLVIFLCGISTALGLMNIQLFRQLSTAQLTPTNAPLAFAYGEEPEVISEVSEGMGFSLGFSGQTVPEFWCLYQQIPHGVYVMHVAVDSDAARKGLSPGDVVVALDGTEVTDAEQLAQLLEIYSCGQEIPVTLCREGDHLDLMIEKTSP